MPEYATKFPIPTHLYEVAKKYPQLISKVTLEAYNFIHERCNKDLKIGAIVASGLSALMAEYERGEHTKAKDFDFGALAHQNDVVLAKSGQAQINITLPAVLAEAAEKNQPLVEAAALKIAPLVRQECGGDKALAAVVATVVAQMVYYDDPVTP